MITIKRALAVCFFSFSGFAAATLCPQALPTTDPNFCASFKASATCHCSKNSLPKKVCENTSKVYSLMILRYGTIENACAHQKDDPDGTTVQTCIDDWKCYRNGGKDSQNGLCSGTGNPCS